MSNRAINERAYLVECERQNIWEFASKYCVQELCRETRAKKPIILIYWLTRPLSAFSAQCTAKHQRLYPTSINDIQPCPKRCLLMLLARVGARTDSTTRTATTRDVTNFPLTYIGIARKIIMLPQPYTTHPHNIHPSGLRNITMHIPLMC